MKKNTPPNRQVERTRQFLLNALIDLIVEKGYEKVTVQDIIDRANVGRTTFYSHFQGKEDLLLSGFERFNHLFENFRSESSPEKSVLDFSLVLFRHADEQRQAFKALYGKQARGVVSYHFEQALIAYLKEGFQATFLKKKQIVPWDVFVQYLSSTFLGLLTWWLDNDISYSAEQMNEYYRKLIEPTTQALLGSA
jgi:AcrR family transcriptional regulator